MRFVIWLSLAACASAPVAWRAPFEEFVRVPPDARWKDGQALVQTSVREWRHRWRDQRVSFLSLVHIGREAYYRSLEPYLADADVVLAEGIRYPGEDAEDAEVVRWVVRSDAAFARALGLMQQSEWEERVTDPRWRVADAPYEDIRGVLEETLRQEVGGGVRRFTELPETRLEKKGDVGPELRRRACEALVTGTVGGYRTETTPPRRLDRLREERMIQAVFDALNEPANRRIVVVCGAYHTWELEWRLRRERRFRLHDTSWHDAVRWEGPTTP